LGHRYFGVNRSMSSSYGRSADVSGEPSRQGGRGRRFHQGVVVGTDRNGMERLLERRPRRGEPDSPTWNSVLVDHVHRGDWVRAGRDRLL
jgi:hypothetical protein